LQSVEISHVGNVKVGEEADGRVHENSDAESILSHHNFSHREVNHGKNDCGSKELLLGVLIFVEQIEFPSFLKHFGC